MSFDFSVFFFDAEPMVVPQCGLHGNCCTTSRSGKAKLLVVIPSLLCGATYVQGSVFTTVTFCVPD